MLPSLKGMAQNFKVFERNAIYYSRDEVTVGEDGYTKKPTRSETQLRVVFIENPEQQYDVSQLGESFSGISNVYVRKQDYNLDKQIEPGNFFKINGVDWKIIEVSDYDSLFKCVCGKKKGGLIA